MERCRHAPQSSLSATAPFGNSTGNTDISHRPWPPAQMDPSKIQPREIHHWQRRGSGPDKVGLTVGITIAFFAVLLAWAVWNQKKSQQKEMELKKRRAKRRVAAIRQECENWYWWNWWNQQQNVAVEEEPPEYVRVLPNLRGGQYRRRKGQHNVRRGWWAPRLRQNPGLAHEYPDAWPQYPEPTQIAEHHHVNEMDAPQVDQETDQGTDASKDMTSKDLQIITQSSLGCDHALELSIPVVADHQEELAEVVLVVLVLMPSPLLFGESDRASINEDEGAEHSNEDRNKNANDDADLDVGVFGRVLGELSPLGGPQQGRWDIHPPFG
ncbi:hypothetical protein G7046_g8283 [Stylonectria norvegica]|nr:hypothetical protein G7046_g8283 [Stylonectria norvegica]